jgi:hypothetical protein
MESNPFVNTGITIEDKELYSKFSRILFICLKNNAEHNDEIFNKQVHNITDIMKKYTILETNNLRLFKDINQKLMIISQEILKQFFEYDFHNKELVIITYLVNENSLRSYLKQHNGISNLEDYINIIYINKYLERKTYNKLEHINRINLLKMMNESHYWSMNICKINNTQTFIERKFNLNNSNSNSNSEIQKILININNKDFKTDNYLAQIAMSIENDLNETNKMKNNSYYITEHKLSKSMTIDNFNMIIDYLVNKKSKEEFYYLIMNLLASKELCHYIINNKYLLKIINKPNVFFEQSFLDKYAPIIKYILGYTWITLYSEEYIKRNKISVNDRFIFDIETASLLPFYHFDVLKPKSSPYLPILVADNVLDINSNCHSILPIYNNDINYGVTTIEIFSERLCYFFSNTKNNLLENLDFTGIGITGSCIACCLPHFNPLHLIFSDFNNFAQEYYKNSDLDIISNLSDFEFIDKAEHINNILKQNIINKLKIEDPDIKSVFSKTVFISVNEDYIKNILNSTLETINFNNPEIKQHFYEKYLKEKKELFEENKDKYSQHKYKNIYDNIDIENITISYRPNIYYQCYENIKYKIFTPYTKTIEFFQVKTNDFFTILSTFHLPIVRAFYNGKTVYMTPSCVSACMTLYNLDVKYFTSTNDPIEIINKYRLRGFGIFLNKNEKLRFLNYSFDVLYWKNKYNIQYKLDLINILKPYDIKNNFYQNNDDKKLYNFDIYNKIYESNPYCNHKYTLMFSECWRKYLYNKYKCKILNDISFIDINAINNKGYIELFNPNFLIIAYALL